ncbi:MAG: gliding motility-associated C-terminal domain-containing protein [Flavobacteriales bacterium]|nr:gliding motility-associated C-terminal domain-containing protein [Flavobacteriales bacterium]
MRHFFILVIFINSFYIICQTVNSGFSWLSTSPTTTVTSPSFNSGSCSNIQYTISSSETFRGVFNGSPYNNNSLIFPSNINITPLFVDMTITFNQPISNLKIRFIDLDENVNGFTQPEESVSQINPAPSSVNLLGGNINPIFLNNGIVTPFDNNPNNNNNDASGWVNWSGNLSSVSFRYNRPGALYALIIDSIYFDCPTNCLVNANAGPDVSICTNQSTTLNANNSNGNQFIWSNGSTASSINVSTPGTYWVSVSNGTCSDIDTVIVSLQNYQPNVLNNSLTICSNNTLSINASNSNVNSYLWNTGQTTSSINVNNPGTYWVQVSNGSCFYNDTVIVSAQTYEPDALENLLVICPNSLFTLDASSTISTTYLWNTGETTSSINANNIGTYWVQVSNGNCSFRDSILVSNQIVNFTPLPTLDYLCDNSTLTINAFDNSTVTYLWNTSESTSNISVNQPGNYWVERTDANGCSLKEFITILEIINQNTESSFVKCKGESVLLTSSQNNNSNYLWNNGTTIGSLVVNESGIYTVTTTNSCGVSLDRFTVLFNDCDCGVYIPNSFTPDEDEFNQVFSIKTDCSFYDFHLEIYNRWGEIIFESFDPNEYWDGNYGAKKVQDGIYTYKVSYINNLNPERINLTGHISLIK